MIIKLEQVSYEAASALMAVLSRDENRDSKGRAVTTLKSATAYGDRDLSLVIEIPDVMVVGDNVESTTRPYLDQVLNALGIFTDTKK